MFKINSVLLVCRDNIDSFINKKILEMYGASEIIAFESTVQALLHLKETQIRYHVILVDIYMPVINGFEFVDKLQEFQLDKYQSKLCMLSASINPLDKKKQRTETYNS